MKNIILSIILFISLLYACKKDNNKNLKEVNRVIVTTKDTKFVVQQLDVLEINPTLQETMQGGGPYAYRWIIYSVDYESIYGFYFTELSTEKNLKKQISVSPGDYYLQYTITDLSTGVKTLNRYNVKVNGAFYEGWLVMSNKKDNAMLSFIREDNVVYYDPVNEINKTQLKGKGLAAYSGVITILSEINAFTDQNVYRLNADDFVLTGTTSSLFNQTITFAEPFYSVSYRNRDQYVISNGKVYATVAPLYYGLPGKYSEAFGGLDYGLFPYYFFGKKFDVVFYDNKNKRFLQTSSNSRTLSIFGNFSGASYDVNNVGKTMVAADRGVQNEFYAVMKDDKGYYLYSILPDLATPAGINQAMLNCPDIAQATSFAASSVLKQLYYAANNTVYVYDILANNARSIYQFPAGTKVKDIKMYKSKGWGKVINPMFDKRLVVATYNGAEGEVYYLDLTPTGDVANNTYVIKFGGFGDIAQINYRNPNEQL